jgi:hypothetical protein
VIRTNPLDFVLPNAHKAERERCAAGRTVLDADCCGMSFGDALDDGESQSGTSYPSPVASPEALKN